jgi:purine-binding chemotaxis protein CheW
MSSVLHVVFKVAGAEYAVSAVDVVQMDSYTGATPVPGSPAYVVGIVQVRGRVVPVVDLRARFGLPAAPTTLESRIVVVQVGPRPVALLVDTAREVLRVEREQLEPPPRVVSEGANGFVKSVARIGARLVMVIDLEQVIGEGVSHGQSQGR